MIQRELEWRIAELERDKEGKGSVGCLAFFLVALICGSFWLTATFATPSLRSDGQSQYLCWKFATGLYCVTVDHIAQ